MGDLRVRMFGHLQSMELGFFTRTKTGIIQSRLQNDVGGVANVLTNTVSSVLGNTVTVISALVAMLLLDWKLTVVAVVLMPFMVIAQRRVGQVRARIAGKTQESLSEMTAITQETLSVSGILLSKSFARQQAETERYTDENRNQISLQVRQSMSGQWFFALVSVFLSSIPAIVYLLAGRARRKRFGHHHGRNHRGLHDSAVAPDVPAHRAHAGRPRPADLRRPVRPHLRVPRPRSPRSPTPRTPAPVPRGDSLGRVEFDHVSFSYPDDAGLARPTLDDVSFTIERGQFAAFVGPSGAGKTTVSYLVPRLYDVSAGAVRFSGVDVRELSQASLVDHIGIVSQETYLFHATIAENLRYAKPEATDAELEAAARAANIHATIDSFPDGYATVVGERGYRLSGGEKQRIAIARVLLKDPEVLVLDEATSALDTISERVVQAAIDDAARGRTTIAIAHRLSTVIDADVIFVVEAGRIVESGTHPELLASGGTYAELYSQQATAPIDVD